MTRVVNLMPHKVVILDIIIHIIPSLLRNDEFPFHKSIYMYILPNKLIGNISALQDFQVLSS